MGGPARCTSSLIAAHRVEWHRRLGVLGAALGALFVLFGSITTLYAAAREVRGHTDFAAGQVVITSLDLLQMLFLPVSSQLQFGSAGVLTITSG
jgi:hypothetical protein